MKRFILTFLLIAMFSSITAQEAAVLPMRDRAKVINSLLEKRVKTLLPILMKRSNIDMWVIISREYNEDPVIKTLLPAEWLNARRRTILVAYRKGDQVETFAVARYAAGTLFKSAWNKEKEPNQWKRLAEIIKVKNPRRIGVNQSTHFALADGIVATDLQEFKAALPQTYRDRIVSAEKLAIGWLETRIPEEITLYRHIVKIAHEIIAEGFSSKVITPGVTTTDDLVWWYRERIRERKLVTWFHPSVMIQRNDNIKFDHLKAFTNAKPESVIQAGDLLHVDFGVTYLRLNSDTQQHAYVCRPGEDDAPAYLKRALAIGNRLQDIFTSRFKVGKTGNEVLKESREAAIREGITPSIYTHPIGYHGHGTGTTLGMWDSQDGVPVKGDYPLHANTAYSIELNATVNIKEWGKSIRIMLEEDAYFDGKKVWYLNGRQKKFHLILNKDGVLGD